MYSTVLLSSVFGLYSTVYGTVLLGTRYLLRKLRYLSLKPPQKMGQPKKEGIDDNSTSCWYWQKDNKHISNFLKAP